MEQLKAWIRYETRTVNVQGELTVAYPLIAGKAKDPHHHWTAVKEKLEAAGFRVSSEPVAETAEPAVPRGAVLFTHDEACELHTLLHSLVGGHEIAPKKELLASAVAKIDAGF